MAQSGWIFDARRCIGCRSCQVACKSENKTPLGTDWRAVVERESGTFPNTKREFISLACNHCDEPACMKSCPEDAISKRASDGIVLIDQSKCVGCRYCVAACPYGACRADTATNKVNKCTMCVHRRNGGLNPACATSCLTGALQFVENFTDSTGTEVPDDFADPRFTEPNITFELMT